MEFTLNSHWGSPAAAQQFSNGDDKDERPTPHYHLFQNIAHDPHLLLVVEIVELCIKPKGTGDAVTLNPPKDGPLKSIGWTIVPIFSPSDDKYVAAGNYQLPMFALDTKKGESVPKDILTELRDGNLSSVLSRELEKKKDAAIKHDDRSVSVWIRIEDEQLGTQYPSTYSLVNTDILSQSLEPAVVKASVKKNYSVDWKKCVGGALLRCPVALPRMTAAFPITPQRRLYDKPYRKVPATSSGAEDSLVEAPDEEAGEVPKKAGTMAKKYAGKIATKDLEKAVNRELAAVTGIDHYTL